MAAETGTEVAGAPAESDLHKPVRVRRVKPWEQVPEDVPWVADVRTFDVPETIAACIRNAAPGMVAITLSRRGGADMVSAAEKAAAERGIRVLWWNGPGKVPDAAEAAARSARSAFLHSPLGDWEA